MSRFGREGRASTQGIIIEDSTAGASKRLTLINRHVSRTDSGVIVLLAPTTVERLVMLALGTATETFANGTGTQTIITLGDEDAPSGILGGSYIFTNLAINGVIGSYPAFGVGTPASQGIIRPGKSLLLTVTPRVGDGTGEANLYLQVQSAAS